MRISLFIVLILLSNFLLAQWHPVSILMDDGLEKEGRTFILDENQKYFKLKPYQETGDVTILNGKNVQKLTYDIAGEKMVFEKILTYKNAKNDKLNKEESLLHILYRGENISLFIGYTPYFPNNIVTNYFSKITYYVQRTNENAASIISITYPLKKKKSPLFFENASKYFKDYDELSSQIKDKKFNQDDILKVVKIYDSWANE